MANEIPWEEKINTFQINPHSASVDDISRMATELSDLKFATEQARSVVEPEVMPNEVSGGGRWQKEQPIKPCMFIARNEYGHQSTLHYARLDDNILCVYNDNEVFITTMEDFIDDEYFIVEYF